MAQSEKVTKQKSVLRTFRLNAALDNSLTKVAARKKTGKNALVASILNKYVEWDSVVEDFGYLTVPWEMITGLVGALDTDSISIVAKQVSKKVASSIPVWFGSADLESLLKYMELSVRFTGVASLQHRVETVGNVTRIVIYQPYDEKATAWARSFDAGLIESVLGYPPKIIVSADSIEVIIESK